MQLGWLASNGILGEVMADNMMVTDTEEGIQAFIDKRPPNWDQS